MVKVCSALCNDCPFSRQSLPGFLADYKVEDFRAFMTHDIMFPCHKQMKAATPIEAVQASIKAGKLKLCRGYVESMVKSAKMPREESFAQIVKDVRPYLDDHSMSIWEFTDHHG